MPDIPRFRQIQIFKQIFVVVGDPAAADQIGNFRKKSREHKMEILFVKEIAAIVLL